MATPQQLADGLCLQYPAKVKLQSRVTIDMAVGFLLQVAHFSLQNPYTWGYIDRPANGTVYFIFTDPQTTFPNDGIRFRTGEQRHIYPVGGRMVEMMEAKFGFIPSSGETIANRIRRRFRLIEGGNPQLVLVQYDRHPRGVAVDPDSHQPTRVRSPQPVNLPAVYVVGEKAGQNVSPSTARGPPVRGVSSGVFEATLPGVGAGVSIPGPGAGGLAHEPDPNNLRGKQRSFKISDKGWILLPDRKRGGVRPLERGLNTPPPSKRRKIAASRPLIPESSSNQPAELLIPSQIENQQPSMHHGALNDVDFLVQSTQKGVDNRGEVQSQGSANTSKHRRWFKNPMHVPNQQQAQEPPSPLTRSPRSGGSPLQHLTVSVCMGERSEGGRLVGAGHPSTHDPSTLVCLDALAWERLISHSFLPQEVISLVEEVFMSKDQVKMILGLRGDDAQNLINVIHEALDLPDLPPRLREKCLAALCRICGRRGLLPGALQVPINYNRSGAPLYRGGFADVWKGEYQGSHVAVKVLRTYSTTDIVKITNRFCKEVVTWNALYHPNVLSLLGVIMDEGQCAMVSEWMANGNINEFVKKHREVNRFELLKDVTEGLIYIHNQGMIHGDLKGANILISQNGHVKLADFGLLTIMSEPTYFTASTSTAMGGTTRWMSPELLHPELFGLDDSHPTKESDCYALGMVIYEVLSGHAPFASLKEYIVIRKVIEGERPGRPEGPNGAWFTADLWEMLNRCWISQAESRPSIEAVLECLGQASNSWKPLPPQVEKGPEEGESDWDLTVLRV